MSDGISGVKVIRPSFPVKPVQPSQKDRESGKRRKDSPQQEPTDKDDDHDKPKIDEYI